mgnify:CR=1 FL=1
MYVRSLKRYNNLKTRKSPIEITRLGRKSRINSGNLRRNVNDWNFSGRVKLKYAEKRNRFESDSEEVQRRNVEIDDHSTSWPRYSIEHADTSV